MRTWKQGVIGKLPMQNGNCVFTKCLKYPLLKIFDRYNEKKGIPENLIYTVFVDLNIVKLIEKCGYMKLTQEEQKLGSLFDLKYLKGSSVIDEIHINDSESIERIKNDGIMNPDKLNETLDKLITHINE
jgi:hypothetical protein